MKRLLIITTLLFLLLPLSVGAEGVSDIYDALPNVAKDALPDSLDSDISKNGEAAVSGLDAGYLVGLLSSSLRTAIASAIKPISTVIGVLILSTLLCSVGISSGGGCGEALGFSSAVSVTVTLFGVIAPLFKLTSDTLSGVGLIMKGIMPVMTGICAMSGSITTASVSATWLTLLLTLLEALTEKLLMPLLCICTGFSAVTALSRFTGAPDMGGVTGALRRSLTFLLAVLGTTITAVMAYQTALAKSADSVALRSLKLASGSMIPVIGGALGEAADGYLAGVAMIRTASGTLSAVVVVSYSLPAVLRLAVMRIGLSVTAVAADILGRGKEAAVVREASEALGIALALLSAVSVMSVIAVGAFAGAFSGG